MSGTVLEGEYQVGTNDTATLVTSSWKGGAGSVVARLSNEIGTEVARTALTADGKFSLTLPRPTDAQLTALDPGDLGDPAEASCQGTVTVSDRAARGTGLVLSVDADQDGLINPETGTSSVNGDIVVGTSASGALIYVDRAVTIKGTQTCTDSGLAVTSDVNMPLSQGWNKVTVTTRLEINLQTESVKGTFTIRSGSFPTDNWIYVKENSAAPLSVQRLNTLKRSFSLFR
ncbi:hypothetical protein [Deinococcus planocerae]|uniref:hypothetical protein n=1 Tax=Deinococcus planocerae TaxID=1737569 RepID=UPI000C7EED12|nr:hypothetical protein [Deinococcus planocerae]